MALEKIREAKRRVGEVSDLLARTDGAAAAKKPLMKRCDNFLTEPLDPNAGDEVRKVRSQLVLVVQELETMLDEEFRVEPL